MATKVQADPTWSIPAFYAGRSILVTGATGFMGKVLIEKLLRSCPDVREIFLLMRPKKGKTVDDRLKEMLALPLFDRLHKERPLAHEKLVPVIGNVIEEGLGLPPVERRFIIERVSVIFHVAASVRFDDSLRDAVFINTRSTRDVCILAANMKNLVALVHISTTYCQSDKPVVEEIPYSTDVDWKKTIKVAENVDDHTLRTLSAKYLGSWPNTYTFTKRLAEQVIMDYSHVIPTVIFRPSIVISSMQEPMEGWVDNFNGPVGILIGGGKGILRIIYTDVTISSDFIPVDVAIKGMIISAWRRGTATITKDTSIHVYNCASCNIRKISSGDIMKLGYRFLESIPIETIWTPNTMTTSSKTVYYLLTLILHLIPSLMIDGILKISGRKPMLVKLHRKVYIAIKALEYFLINSWEFRNEKFLTLLMDLPPGDMEAFSFDYKDLDITEYFRKALIGAKTYLLKEDMSKVEETKRHRDRLWWIDLTLKIWLSVVFLWMLWRYSLSGYLSETTRYNFDGMRIMKPREQQTSEPAN